MKLKAISVAAEPAAREPRPLDRALAFLDPLFRRTAWIVKRQNALVAAAHVGDDEADARKQLSGMPLDLDNDSTRLSPTSRLIAETRIPPSHVVRWPADWALEQMADSRLQDLIGR